MTETVRVGLDEWENWAHAGQIKNDLELMETERASQWKYGEVRGRMDVFYWRLILDIEQTV